MPYLLTMLASGLASIVTAFVAFFGRKASVVALSISAFIFLVAALIICIKQLIFYVMTLAIIPAWISFSLGLFVPSNFSLVLSAILASHSCKFAYDIAIAKVKLINSAV